MQAAWVRLTLGNANLETELDIVVFLVEDGLGPRHWPLNLFALFSLIKISALKFIHLLFDLFPIPVEYGLEAEWMMCGIRFKSMPCQVTTWSNKVQFPANR